MATLGGGSGATAAAKKKKKERKRIVSATAGAWECPFCKRMNGIPERTGCECGSKVVGGGWAERE